MAQDVGFTGLFEPCPQALLRSPEEPNHNPGGCPIVVLMDISAERRPVIVDVNQAYLEVSRWFEIQAAAHFVRNTAVRSRVTAGTADRDIRAGSSHQAFNKRGYPPS